jgi:hypothetical protein
MASRWWLISHLRLPVGGDFRKNAQAFHPEADFDDTDVNARDRWATIKILALCWKAKLRRSLGAANMCLLSRESHVLSATGLIVIASCFTSSALSLDSAKAQLSSIHIHIFEAAALVV